MSEQSQNDPGSEKRTGDAWQEVGRQFETLGESLAQALKTAWESERNRQRAEAMRSGLESMINDVGQVIRDTAHSEQGQQVVSEVKETAANLRQAGEQTVQEVRPHLVNALQKVNEELTKLINSIEKDKDSQS